MESQHLAGELLRRRRARASLAEFSQAIDIPAIPLTETPDAEDPTTGKLLDPIEKAPVAFSPIETRVAPHHLLMMQAIQRCIEKPRGRLMIFAPPGSAKSTYASVVAPAWIMGKKPNTQIILASYGTGIAAKQSR